MKDDLFSLRLLGGIFNVLIDEKVKMLEIDRYSTIYICQNSGKLESPVITNDFTKYENVVFLEKNLNGSTYFVMKGVEFVRYIDQFIEMKPIKEKTYEKSVRSYVIYWKVDPPDSFDSYEVFSKNGFNISQQNVHKMKLYFKDEELEEVIFSHLLRWKKTLHSQVGQIKKLYNLSFNEYNSSNLDHESYLFKLWDYAFQSPEGKTRISSQWKTLGFSQEDPFYDFHNVGIHGLLNLVYFMENYNETCKKILSQNRSYSFALIGIKITSMLYEILNLTPENINIESSSNIWISELLHFMCYCRIDQWDKYEDEESLEKLTQHIFNEVYCQSFLIFDRLWITLKAKETDTANIMFSTKTRIKFILRKRPFSLEQFLSYSSQELMSIK